MCPRRAISYASAFEFYNIQYESSKIRIIKRFAPLKIEILNKGLMNLNVIFILEEQVAVESTVNRLLYCYLE